MAAKNNANIGFEKQLWDAACVLWGHIPAAEYRKVIIGLIFLRYISNAFEKRYQELVAEGDGFEDDRDAYAEDNIFFVPEDARWSKIASAAHTPEIGTIIDNAMRAIEAENKSLKNVLPKNYASPDLDKRVLGDVVDLFTNMDMGDTEESKDLLGRTYEYCIAQFAAYEGVKGGEFYTPSSIVKTIVAILKPFANCRVYEIIFAFLRQILGILAVAGIIGYVVYPVWWCVLLFAILPVILYFSIYKGMQLVGNCRINSKTAPEVHREADGFSWVDLNQNGKMDIYEEPRESAERRVEDLRCQMTVEEKAGLMFSPRIDVVPADKIATRGGFNFDGDIVKQIYSNKINTFCCAGTLSPIAFAEWQKAVQQAARKNRLGIPIRRNIPIVRKSIEID